MAHFWAAIEELAAKKKIGRKMLYKELKAQLEIGSVTDLDSTEIDDMAFEMEATAATL